MSGYAHIKVNLPRTMEDYQTGNGEGVFVIVDYPTKIDYDKDKIGMGYHGILDNDSFYFPELKHGMVIPFEMRGENRPVADFPNFLSKFAAITNEEKEELLRSIAERQTGGAE